VLVEDEVDVVGTDEVVELPELDAELVTDCELDEAADDVEETDELEIDEEDVEVIPFVVVVVLDTVAKYNPTPATNKITTIITTTIALDIAFRLFLSDMSNYLLQKTVDKSLL
jgi:hypothetical protein